MPLVRIDLSGNLPSRIVRGIGDTVGEALRAIAHVPEGDKFQVITYHARDELVYAADGYLGITYSLAIVFIQVTWNSGRPCEMKKSFYKALADGIHAKTGLRKQDIVISPMDVAREGRSFGNSDRQYSEKQGVSHTCCGNMS
ncbi:tautomerase family protein [Paraburkholderia sp. 2C]